uniref:Integrase catalytic domain-containing protein n=1 Tax=Gouania willdenowi TaxID=441366 RepID=A0A8C5GW46_GOUWI
MDFIGPLPTTEKCHRYVLTFTDYYTMFVDLYPLKDKTAAGVANCIRTFVCRWGAPRRLLSDQGPEFVAEITTEACRSFNITTPVTRASHPQTNGLDERTNQTLKMRLSKLVNEHPTDWDTFLEDLAYSVRTQNQATTKYSPFFLMFGRHPRPTREMDSGDEPHEGLPTAPEVKLDEMVARRQEVIAVVKQHVSTFDRCEIK